MISGKGEIRFAPEYKGLQDWAFWHTEWGDCQGCGATNVQCLKIGVPFIKTPSICEVCASRMFDMAWARYNDREARYTPAKDREIRPTVKQQRRGKLDSAGNEKSAPDPKAEGAKSGSSRLETTAN